METSIREFSGRTFCTEEIDIIKEVVKTYRHLSQNELAYTIGEILEWTTPNGRPKGTSCLRLLQKLEADGEVELPPLREYSNKGWKFVRRPAEGEDMSWMETSEITECGSLTLKIARPGELLRRWRSYIRAFHMIGDTSVYGHRICYMVESEGRDVGCLQFSASAWSLAARDEWIGWTVPDKKARLHLVVNNSRTLILPWVHAANLGSRILSQAARQVLRDWLAAFCYEPVLLETFVDTSFYSGTIYKAANWTYLGNTKGRGRNDRHSEKLLTEKAIFTYPLRRDFREVLKGEKPCRAVNPDDLP